MLHRWVVLFVMWALAAPAWAYNIRFCAVVDTAFSLTGGGDVWTSDSGRAGFGFRYNVLNTSNSVLYSGAVAADGLTPGCEDIPISLTGTIKFRLLGEAIGLGDDNAIQHAGAGTVTFGNHTLSGDATFTETVTGPNAAYEQLVAMAYALNEHDGGNADEDFAVDNDGCCSYDGTEIHLGSATVNKYLIIETFGYAVTQLRAAGAGNVVPTHTLADDDDCDGGPNWLRKKHQSLAMVDGLATWYSLITWNDKDDANCDFRGTAVLVDFDLDGSGDYTASSGVPCNGVLTGVNFTDGTDWLHDLVVNNDSAGDSLDCDDETTDRSADWDWWVYLWNMYSSGDGDPGDGVTAVDIVDIFVDLDPMNWDKDGGGSAGDDPWPLWDASAISLEPDAHDVWYPGIDH